jgi:hypothetical protein
LGELVKIRMGKKTTDNQLRQQQVKWQ